MRYLVVPGHVRSVADRDLHYISASQLIHLYKVRACDCLVYQRDERLPYRLESQRYDSLVRGRIVLTPRRNGDYTLPKEGLCSTPDTP